MHEFSRPGYTKARSPGCEEIATLSFDRPQTTTNAMTFPSQGVDKEHGYPNHERSLNELTAIT
jgi:hypothetical protein